MTKTIDPKKVSTAEFHGFLLGAVAPRPIAFASTVDKDGNVNLSPFSFFNCFGANPPILIFSPARRVRDNTTKHTLENVLVQDEVVINVVNHAIVEQMSLSSTEYGTGVNEFVKAGLTEVPSEKVKPPRVGESPAAFECKVLEVKPLGEEGGAGNLIICEVLLMHVKEEVLNDQGKIDPHKIDLVARMGGNYYSRATGDALFEIAKPIRNKGIGVDQIPESIRNSHILSGNNLGQLGNIESVPDQKALEAYRNNDLIQEIFKRFVNDPMSLERELHELGKEYLAKGEVENAWKVLLQEP